MKKIVKLSGWNIFLFIIMPILIGCTTYKQLPDIPISNPTNYKIYQNQAGFLVAIDPFIEQERLVQYFGRDLLFYGLLPIHILIENKNNATQLILRENIVLFTDNNKTILQESLDWAKMSILKERHGRRVATGALMFFVPLAGILALVADSQDQADAQTVLQNISSKALFDKSLFRGEQQNGFVYFPLNDLTAENGFLNLQIKLKDLGAENTSTLNFNIDTKELNKRIKEIILLWEGKKNNEDR